MTDRDVEGQWVWDSDGSPVSWTRWVNFISSPPDPNGGVQANCAVMLRNQHSDVKGHTFDAWNDLRCGSQEYRSDPKTLICQKNPGML